MIKKNPEIIQIFVNNGHNQVFIESSYTQNDRSSKSPEEKVIIFKDLFYHDTITGYYNWNYIWPRIAFFDQYGIQDYSFVYFDIKDFKAVNVIYGHLTANNLLKNITRHMEEMDWVYCSARCDNDNFAMMIKDMPEEETREKLEQFFEGISYLEEDRNYRVYYRCGVVPMRISVEMGNLVADAGKQAKAFGTKPFTTEIIFFTDEMREEQNRAIQLRTYLDCAIERDEFLVYLQPKYDIQTEKIKGAEALIRWAYKGKTMLSPGLFVPLFESGGLIGKIDDIVLKKVCMKLKEWDRQGKPLYPISVNISRKSVGAPGLVDHLTEIVDSYGVDHSLIDFELTESAANDNQDNMIKVIEALYNQGFKISMDDFGTGYSSLSLLPIMHFDTLKIDKSFVDGIGKPAECAKNCAVVKQIVALAKDLNLICLAEGAESKEQVELLRDFGCEVVQGYYYSKPLPVEDYEKLL
ncbi:MAG: GGDEF domain-containing phosphodiesterase [Eubacteriales bacterium]|nr:GGDEF domain-containing phosphodiesterase [Eubacteriales bacterium]